MNLEKTKIINTCDKIILFSLYAIAYFIPISKAIIETATIIAILFYLLKKFLQWQDIPKTRINIPIFSYLIVCIFSMFISNNLEISTRTFFAKTLKYFALFFVVTETLNSERRLRNILFILLASSALLGIDGIFQYFTHKDFLRHRPYIALGGRIYASLATPNDFGCYLISVLPFAIAFSFYKFRAVVWRNLFILLSLLLFSCLVLTISRGAWYGFLASIIFMSLWIPSLMLFFLTTVLFIAVTRQYYSPLLKQRLSKLFVFDAYSINDNGGIDRKMMWQGAWKMFVSHPWLGIGLGTFMFNFKTFAPDNYPFSVPYAHNCYLQMLSETGIAGLLFFLSILILFFYQGIKILNKSQRTFSWYVLLASLAGILSYCTQMSVDTSFYSLDLGTLFWLILGLGAAVSKNVEKGADESMAAINMNKMTLKDINLKNKIVLVRVDFNVPQDENLNITDDTRIKATLPTIKYILQKGAKKIILISHLGRPDGKFVTKYTLKPVAQRLKELLNEPVNFLNDCVGDNIKKEIHASEEKIILLENLRFHAQEEANDPIFAKQLASLADIFVNDAFGTAHRAHASTEGLTHYIKSVAGFLLEKEICYLGNAVQNPKRPFMVILGGAKVSDKLGVIENLLPKADAILIGGGMSYTFLKAQGKSIGNSKLEKDKLDLAKSILDKAGALKKEILLPIDHMVVDNIDPKSKTEISGEDIPEGKIAVDIGPKTINLFEGKLKSAKTIVWNGPLGIFEMEPFSQGTKRIAEFISALGATTIIGGGDTAAAIAKFKLEDKMTHISTGGGASLEFLEGKTLPGIAALADK